MCSTPCIVIYSPNETNEMHKHCILFQVLLLHISVYTTILRVITLTDYISVAMCKVQYMCSIYNNVM